ncbi:MAG: ABC transporter permease [Rhizobiaceae bacterium]
MARRLIFLKSALPVISASIVLLLLWQAIVVLFEVPRYIIPAPLDIMVSVYENGPILRSAALVTVSEAVGGFAIGAILGVAIAILMIIVPPLEASLLPLAFAVNAVPIIAFVPLALVLFGLGMASKVVIAALAVVFVVMLNMLAGLKRPDPAAFDLMRSFGAGRLDMLWRLQLPASMPFLVTGLRVGISRSTIAVIVAEMIGAYTGLGQIIYRSTIQSDNLLVWSAVLVATAVSLIIYLVLVVFDERLVWWK